MKTELEPNNGLIKVKWGKKHKLFPFLPGDIDYVTGETAVKLISEGYVKQVLAQDEDSLANRIKNGQKVVRVKWMKSHPSWSYFSGNISYLIPSDAETLIEGNYVKEISEQYREPVPVKVIIPESEFTRVKFLKPHSSFSYSEGDIAKIHDQAAVKLLEGEYIELVKDEYIEPVPVETIPPKSEMIDVIFLKAHQLFAYKKGSLGTVSLANAKILLKGDFVDLFAEDIKTRNQIFKKLGYAFDPKRKTIIKL